MCAGDSIVARDYGLSICAGVVVLGNLGERDVDGWIIISVITATGGYGSIIAK